MEKDMVILSFSSSLSGKEHSVFTGVAIVLCHEKESKYRLRNCHTCTSEIQKEAVPYYRSLAQMFLSKNSKRNISAINM